MRQPSLFFEPEAQYAFVSDGKEVGVSVSERVTLRLGNLSPDLPTADDIACQAVVCRVQVSHVELYLLSLSTHCEAQRFLIHPRKRYLFIVMGAFEIVSLANRLFSIVLISEKNFMMPHSVIVSSVQW